MKNSFESKVTRNSQAAIVVVTRALIENVKAGQAPLEDVIELGDRLTQQLVTGCNSIVALLAKYNQHKYRPTLRGDVDARCIALADLYDFLAAELGVRVQAFRG